MAHPAAAPMPASAVLSGVIVQAGIDSSLIRFPAAGRRTRRVGARC
ncbi:MAG: hypothetical protein MZV49_06710 [Rhodopseudomonas palustris]|nr:hypothetical protein [Rhodopseudomonas palustris]